MSNKNMRIMFSFAQKVKNMLVNTIKYTLKMRSEGISTVNFHC